MKKFDIDNLWDGNLPVNILNIACAVYSVSTHGENFMQIKDNTILIPQDWGYTRSRYALAYALHAHEYFKKDLEITVDDFKINGIVNRYLNHRTLDTLMPKDILEFVIGSGKATTMDSLTELFGVSQAAVRTQCKLTGII